VGHHLTHRFRQSLEESVGQVMAHLETRGIIPPPGEG